MSRAAAAGSGRGRASRPTLAVLVPYRDRPEQLAVFVPHMRRHLAAQGEGAIDCSRTQSSGHTLTAHLARSGTVRPAISCNSMSEARPQYLTCGSLAAGIVHVVIVAEQLGTGPFNRGALLNFAFLAADASITALAIVDVDMLPLPGVNFSDAGCDTI